MVRGARNILPILWIKERELTELNNLPPYAVRDIQYTIKELQADLHQIYKQQGMYLITTNRKGTYRRILDHLAAAIVKLSDNPLPSLDPPPNVTKMRNAFWDPPTVDELPAVPASAQQSGGTVAGGASVAGPSRILGLEVRRREDATCQWTPYGGPLSLRGLVEEIVVLRHLVYSHETFDPSAADFSTAVWSSLAKATADNVRPILFVHPACLGNEKWRNALVAVLRRDWRGGVIIPVDAADKASVDCVEKFESVLQPPPEKLNWIVVRPSRTTRVEAGFRTAVLSVASEILARIVDHADVQQLPQNRDVLPIRPRIANILDTRRGLS